MVRKYIRYNLSPYDYEKLKRIADKHKISVHNLMKMTALKYYKLYDLELTLRKWCEKAKQIFINLLRISNVVSK